MSPQQTLDPAERRLPDDAYAPITTLPLILSTIRIDSVDQTSSLTKRTISGLQSLSGYTHGHLEIQQTL